MIVFVSFSSTNREAVEALVVQLGALGHDVEYEVKFIGGPLTWKHAFASISNCDLFVATVTRETLLSYTCEVEYQYARSINKNILAVLLEDLSTEELPDMKVKGLVDFRVATPESLAQLAETIAAMPAPVPPVTAVIPPANWVTPLADLRKQIENLSRDAREQRGVILNIKEFMERRESFEPARSLMDALAAQNGLRQQTIGELDYIRSELANVRVSTRVARRRRTIVSAITLSAVVALVAVILSQLFFRFRANYNVELNMTRTAEVIAASQMEATASPSAVATTATLVSTVATTATPTIIRPTTVVPDAASPTALVALATNTAMPLPTSTPIPPTATLLPPSGTAIPSTATATRVPPTSTHTITPEPPTATQGFSFAPTSVNSADMSTILPQSTYIGITVEDTAGGIRVTGMEPGAKAAGVQVGDYMLAVDLDVVTTRDQFLQSMQTHNPFSRITLRVRRDGGIHIITIVLGVNDFTVATPSPA